MIFSRIDLSVCGERKRFASELDAVNNHSVFLSDDTIAVQRPLVYLLDTWQRALLPDREHGLVGLSVNLQPLSVKLCFISIRLIRACWTYCLGDGCFVARIETNRYPGVDRGTLCAKFSSLRHLHFTA